MQFLAYIVIYPFLWLISILPFRLLYIFSDFIYLLVYYVIGYRRKVVKENLCLVFPKKTDKEIKAISKKFYSHMCDMFLEMIKTLTISRKQLNKRFIIKNPEKLQQLESLNKSIVVMYGHYASYEWSFVVENHISLKGIGIYKKIANRYFDNLVKKIRSRYNTELIDTKKAVSRIAEYEKKGVKSAIWNVKTHELKLIYDERKTDLKAIQERIASVGHDTKEVKASDEAYNNVHPCCKYRDEDVKKDHDN